MTVSRLIDLLSSWLTAEDDPTFWATVLGAVLSDAEALDFVGRKADDVVVRLGACSHWSHPHWVRWKVAGGFASCDGYQGAGAFGFGLPEFDWSVLLRRDERSGEWNAVDGVRSNRARLRRGHLEGDMGSRVETPLRREALATGERQDRALEAVFQEAAARAVDEHGRIGNPVAAWEDNRVVELVAEEPQARSPIQDRMKDLGQAVVDNINYATLREAAARELDPARKRLLEEQIRELERRAEAR